ncbi:hypothetical protein BVX98_05440 [bacterium F11]|nr:hypothetical protein BVX98_05440 [bacterium F11]
MAEPNSKEPQQKILVVEDDSGVSSMLKEILTDEGFDVSVAADGKKATELLSFFSPDLVLLDLQVPHRKGHEILRDIREKDHQYGIFVPVIVLTGVYTTREDKVTSLNAGADDFLPKPFDLVELLARVRSLLRVRELYKRSQYLASHDHLTRCYNRRYLLDFLDREAERYKRYKAPFSYFLIDLDYFKSINDQFGHDAGDQVLMNVGFQLQDFFRAVDCVARLGGDEFAIVLPDLGPGEAQKVGDRLIGSMDQIRKIESLPKEMAAKIGFSVGGACLPTHTNDKEELMRLADEAMYYSKKAGRNQFHLAPLP